MPSTQVIRCFDQFQFIHIANKGINGEAIFLHKYDYLEFIKYLAIYLWEPDRVISQWPKINNNLLENNFHQQIELQGFCLMPNHFHLLLKQAPSDATSNFLKSIKNAYTGYFNTKYSREGSLFQGRFRATYPQDEASLLKQSRYIHLNPLKAGLVNSIHDYPWSSIHDYTKRRFDLCRTDTILSCFKDTKDYLDFVERVQPSDLNIEPKNYGI